MNLHLNYKKGDRVVFAKRDGTTMVGTYDHHCPNGCAYIKADDGAVFERKYQNIRKEGEPFLNNPQTSEGHSFGYPPAPVVESQWDINQRFGFLQQLVRAVLQGTSVSLIITGEGGLGKTYSVKRELLRRRLNKGEDFIHIKGYSTARGLYRTLYENNGMLIIFDDCDSVLEDKVAINILKGALDSYDEREISWLSQSFTDDIPSSFLFTGRVIFISNRSQESIDKAILSRSVCIDLSMTPKEKVTRMEHIIQNSRDFMPEIPMDIKMECLELIRDNKEKMKELSLRSLEKVIKIRIGDHDDFDYDGDDEDMVTTDWKVLAEYMIMN